jgi:hypothetical protein
VAGVDGVGPGDVAGAVLFDAPLPSAMDIEVVAEFPAQCQPLRGRTSWWVIHAGSRWWEDSQSLGAMRAASSGSVTDGRGAALLEDVEGCSPRCSGRGPSCLAANHQHRVRPPHLPGGKSGSGPPRGPEILAAD